MNPKFTRIFTALFVIIPIVATSQTTTFNYVNTNLGSKCNVFSPSVNVNNVAHASHAGGVAWNSSNGLQLYTYPSGSSAGGTAFTINYSFTAGASYTIAVTALGNSALSLKTAVVPNLNQFSTNGTGTCTPDPNVTLYSLVGTGNISTPTSSSSTTYTTPSFAGSGQSILIVWATGGRTNVSLDVLSISQIEITKTAGASSFTLPATTNVQCGSTTPTTLLLPMLTIHPT